MKSLSLSVIIFSGWVYGIMRWICRDIRRGMLINTRSNWPADILPCLIFYRLFVINLRYASVIKINHRDLWQVYWRTTFCD